MFYDMHVIENDSPSVATNPPTPILFLAPA